MQIKFSAEFKKSYKTRIQKNEKLKELFWETLELFDHDPFHTSLRTHRLSGSLEGKWAFSVDYDCRQRLSARLIDGQTTGNRESDPKVHIDAFRA